MKSTVMNESVYSCLKFSNTPYIFMHYTVCGPYEMCLFPFYISVAKKIITETCFYMCELNYVM